MDKFWVEIFCCCQGKKHRHSIAIASIFNADSRAKTKSKMYIYLLSIPKVKPDEEATLLEKIVEQLSNVPL